MPYDVTNFIPNQFAGNQTQNYTTDFIGSVKLLEDSGFNPYRGGSPLSGTLNQVFDRFVQKTGLDTTASKLTDEFLLNNPTTRNALGVYDALENTFASRNAGQQSAIVDFLSSKIDTLMTDRDTDQNSSLNLLESGFSRSIFDQIDRDEDLEISGDEFKNDFFNSFSELNNVLNYFQSNRGVLLDTYG